MRDRPQDRRQVIRCLRRGTVLTFVGAVALTGCSSSDEPAARSIAFDEPDVVVTTSSTLALTSTALVAPTTVTSTMPSTSTPPAAPPTSAVVAVAPPTVAPAPTDPPAPTVETSQAAPAGGATYSTLPDGSPSPIVAVFDTDLVTISGAVPTEADRDQLEALAIATSKSPAAVANLLTIDPTVPIGVGVRVVELTSTRFPESSYEVLPEHAMELDRLVAVMNAFPNTTVLIIGHADQHGPEQTNDALSAARAAAVVDHLTRAGIDASRLSSRAVGERDLLTLNSDEASLALNRRTEFIVYGLLAAA